VTPPGIDTGTVQLVVQCLNHYTTPGPINILHRLIKEIWIEKKVPTDWKTNIIVKIYKIQATNYSVTTTKEYH